MVVVRKVHHVSSRLAAFLSVNGALATATLVAPQLTNLRSKRVPICPAAALS